MATDFIQNDFPEHSTDENNNDAGEYKPLNVNPEKEPELYSPQVIGIFALLFSIIFGGILLIINLYRLKNKKAIKQVAAFSFLYTATEVVVMNQFKTSAPIWSVILNVVGALLLTNYYWRVFIGIDIKYRKRYFVVPLIIGVGLSFLLLKLMVIMKQYAGIQ